MNKRYILNQTTLMILYFLAVGIFIFFASYLIALFINADWACFVADIITELSDFIDAVKDNLAKRAK